MNRTQWLEELGDIEDHYSLLGDYNARSLCRLLDFIAARFEEEDEIWQELHDKAEWNNY